MENTREVPFIKLGGSPHERGLAHGKAVAKIIKENIEFYKTLLKLDDATLRTQAKRFAQITASFRPVFVEEMDGIAEGANVDPDYIYMLNARTEILSMTDGVHSECASFYFAQTGILFENWDWSEPSKDMTVLLSINLPDGNNILTFTEAGMLGKIGISSAGFGVAFNYLYPVAKLDGLPIHTLLRAILEATSFQEAAALLSKNEYKGTSGNILLADATGHAIDFELSGAHTTELKMNAPYVTHTNHYLGGTLNDPAAGEGFLHNSFERYTRAQEIISKTTDYTLATAEKILTDRKTGDGMLCRNFIPEDMGDIPFGTIASIVMDLPQKIMYIATNPQSENAQYKIYTL